MTFIVTEIPKMREMIVMSISNYNEIIKSVKKSQTKERYDHTLGVAYTAASMAMKYEIDLDKAFLAGILHDCAKCISDELMLEKCESYNIYINEFERQSPYLLHAKLGAYYAQHTYGIDDDEILNSIIYHTTGRADMSLLEKIVFVADYIEPARDRAPRLAQIRKTSFENIDMAVYMIIRDTISYLRKRDKSIDTTSIDTYNYYKEIINKDTEGDIL